MLEIYDDYGRQLLAVLLSREDYLREDIRFFSDVEDALQVGSLLFSRGSTVKPHLHKLKSPPSQPMEMILVLAGGGVVDVYDESGDEVASHVLEQGDIFIQKRGGHGYRFNRKTRLLDIKTGPYLGKDSDKEMI